MAAKPQRSPSIETVWLREYARTYEPSEAGFWFPEAVLRDSGVRLIDVRHSFGCGTVVSADKLDGPGARWIVEGEDCDGNPLALSIIVSTQELSVTLEHVKRITEASVRENDHEATGAKQRKGRA